MLDNPHSPFPKLLEELIPTQELTNHHGCFFTKQTNVKKIMIPILGGLTRAAKTYAVAGIQGIFPTSIGRAYEDFIAKTRAATHHLKDSAVRGL